MKTKKMLFVLFVALMFSCTENDNSTRRSLETQTVIEEKSSQVEEIIFEQEIETIVEQKEENHPINLETTEVLETISESKSNANDEIILDELETIVEQN